MSSWPIRETVTIAELVGTGRSVTDTVMARKAELKADWYRINRDPDGLSFDVIYHSNTEEFPDADVGAQQEEKSA